MAWLNTVFATEQLVKQDGQTMVGFYFQEDPFIDQVASTREHYQKWVAAIAIS